MRPHFGRSSCRLAIPKAAIRSDGAAMAANAPIAAIEVGTAAPEIGHSFIQRGNDSDTPPRSVIRWPCARCARPYEATSRRLVDAI